VDADHVPSEITEILITDEQLQRRLAEVAAQVDADYAGRDLLLVGVLKGATIVVADFMRHLKSHVTVDWMAVSSYGSGTQSSGVVRILKDLDGPIEDLDVIVVEDIVDSGLTLSYLLRNLKTRKPATLEVCSLLAKPARLENDVNCRYVGFEIPDTFVVGYGLDAAEQFRELPDIWSVDETKL
jgi:hypoxanthine phosphoribosyltransferase